MKKIVSIFVAVILVSSILAGCGANNETGNTEELVPITIMLDWVPNTNHTGMYVALEKGWYEEQGLDVEIIQPTEGGTAQLIAAKKADFGISYQEEVTYARTNELPVVSIAAIIQHNTSGFASPKNKNIVTPEDFEGKKYGGWGSPIEHAIIKSIMDKYNANVEKVEFVSAGSADFFTVTTEKDIDFEWIYYGWTGVEAELRDFPINYIEIREIAPELDFYTPVIIANEEYLEEKSDVVKSFLEATTKGYEFAIENPEEAANSLIKAVPGINEELVKRSQEWLSKKYQEDAEQWGIQKEKIWTDYANWMHQSELIPEMIDVKHTFTNEYLPKR